ncbi:MAG: hypothetical protein R3B93_21530 [Bacteroidia bacterium]
MTDIDTGEYGEGDKLNKTIGALTIRQLFKSYFIKANYKIKDIFYSGQLADRYLTYYITIVPEKEANLQMAMRLFWIHQDK